MRLGFDARFLTDRYPGVGRYAFNLLRALAAIVEDDELVALHRPGLGSSRFDLSTVDGIRRVAVPFSERSPLEPLRLPALACRLGLDLLHTPFLVASPAVPCRRVVTLQDLIPLRVPATLRTPFSRLAYRVSLRWSARADRLLVPSAATRDDAVRFLGRDPGTMTVVPLGVETRFRPPAREAVAELRHRLGLPERYVLFLGTRLPHKNVEGLLAAWSELRAGGRDRGHELVLAGRGCDEPSGPGVRALGLVADADLPALHGGASLLVLPSLVEGFGLTVLEAMACGVPVACSSTPSLLEVAGDAARTFDPEPSSIAAALADLLGSPDELAQLSERGRERARSFSWDETARRTLEVYRELVSSATRR